MPSPSEKTRTLPYSLAEQLRTSEEIAAYLNAWLSEAPDDATGIVRALAEVAHAKGIEQVARATGLSLVILNNALSENGDPSFTTVLKVAKALGVKLHAEAS